MTAASQVTVGTTAVRMAVAAKGLGGSLSYLVKNLDASATVYFGGSTVTTSTGYPLGPGSFMSMDVTPGNDLWAVVASGSAIVAVIGES